MTINGKVSAFLELGNGINPENTGYENIYLNVEIFGMEKENIQHPIWDKLLYPAKRSDLDAPRTNEEDKSG